MQSISKQLEERIKNIIFEFNLDAFLYGDFNAEGDLINTHYFLLDGKRQENIVFELKGTPCEDIIDKGVCSIHESAGKVYEDFAFFKELKIDSYVGILLLDEQNEPLGIIVALSRYKQKRNTALVKAIEEIQMAVTLQLEKAILKNQIAAHENKEIQLSDLAHFGSWEFTLRSGRMKWSKSLKAIFQIEEDISNAQQVVENFVLPEYQAQLDEVINTSVKNKEAFSTLIKVKTSQGKIIDIYSWGDVVLNEIKEVIGLYGISQDVTKMKMIENKAEEADFRFQSLFNNANDAVFILDKDNAIDCNIQAAKLFETERERLINKSPIDFSPAIQPDGESSAEKAIQYIQKAYEGKSQRFEWMHVTDKGREFLAEVSLIAIDSQDDRYIMALVRDISKEKLALEKLVESEEIFRNTFNSFIDLYIETTLDATITIISPSVLNILGYNSEEVIGQKSYNYYANPDARVELIEALKNNGVLNNQEVAVVHKDGHLVYMEANMRYYPESGNIVSILRDISAEKMVRMKLQEEQKLQDSIVKTLAEGIAVYNQDFKPIIHNQKAYELLQITEDQFNGRDLYSSDWMVVDTQHKPLPPDQFPVVITSKTGEKINDFVMGVKTNESITWLTVNTSPLEYNEEALVLVSYSDITDRVERRLDEQILSVAFQSLNEGVVIQDKDGIVIQSNEAACSILGLSPGQLEGRDSFHPQWRSIHSDGSPCPGEEHPVPITLATGKEIWGQIMGIHKPDDTLSWISINSSPIYFDKKEGLPDAAIATFTDITEKMYNEQELNLLNTAVSQLSNHVMITNNKGQIQYINPAFENATGFKLDEIQGMRANVLKSGQQGESFYKSMWGTIMSGRTFQSEIINKAKDGRLIVEELFITPIFDNKGEIANFIAIYTDLEEKQKAKLASQQLEEKELLLKEIHHRVKNNLQIVSSLLSLQANQIDDAHFVALFQTSQQRVASIALVHEKLYQSKNLDVVNIQEYVSDLIEKIVDSSENAQQPIQKIVNVADVYINLDKAVPLGLIINEVLSNAFKYAFDASIKNPTIKVEIFEAEEVLNIQLSDNGKGIEDIDKAMQSQSLGMKLVKTLSLQLGCEMEVDTAKNKGVKYKLTCPI